MNQPNTSTDPFLPPETAVLLGSTNNKKKKSRRNSKTTKGVYNTLKKAHSSDRTKIVKLYRSLGGQFKFWNNKEREILTEAIFKVENDLDYNERKGCRERATVLSQIRNNLYDELGWNEKRNAPA